MSSDAINAAEHDKAFVKTLEEFLANLCKRFPDQEGIQSAQSMNSMALFNTAMYKTKKREAWAAFTLPILQQIMDEDAEVVSRAIEEEATKNPLIGSIGIDTIITDAAMDSATRENTWKYIQILTIISQQGTGVVIPPFKTKKAIAPPLAEPSILSAVAKQPIAAAAAPVSSTPDIGKIIEGLSDSLPKVMDAFNKIIEKDGGNNPMAQMMKQFMNPNQLQPGTLNNIAATVMDRNVNPSVMHAVQDAMGELSAEDILNKLKKLERLEKLHEKRKSRGN